MQAKKTLSKEEIQNVCNLVFDSLECIYTAIDYGVPPEYRPAIQNLQHAELILAAPQEK